LTWFAQTSPPGSAISNSGKSAFLRTDVPLPVGSNAVAVASSRSADGATRLLVNFHQPYTGPVSWYEAVLDSGEGWPVAGGVFPGSPFPLHGHNQHLGWANTVKVLYIIEGEVTLIAGSLKITAKAGSLAYIPAHCVHSFRVDADKTRLLNFYFPGGYHGRLAPITDVGSHGTLL